METKLMSALGSGKNIKDILGMALDAFSLVERKEESVGKPFDWGILGGGGIETGTEGESPSQ